MWPLRYLVTVYSLKTFYPILMVKDITISVKSIKRMLIISYGQYDKLSIYNNLLSCSKYQEANNKKKKNCKIDK